jgi:hypothetical protein
MTATMTKPTHAIAEIAADAYTFLYPLVLMDITRQQMTATPRVAGFSAPVNQFVHIRPFRTPPSRRLSVRMPIPSIRLRGST